ncbi:hypothetical protein GCK72_008328 [Caenorhabditis remanei]|uniref:G-protein coupled receptors family 1 profile domain-containing protein n=1 Tax=Caenorhabditis remanei TaxID=31234 RepID=A0A6A5H0R5_CAERE|nr:hypothetical protein GCK72_008328 [Caenorhabditis remanei]KAF1760082.1 hypothetical protein GCK72_008328 [Caenorhabditis remanei]
MKLTDYFKYNIVPNDEDYKCTQYMTTEFRWYWNQVFTYYPNKKAYTYIKITESLLSKRQKLESSSETKKSKNTSKLVLCLTLSFFIAELPLGIVFWMSQSSIVLGEERFFFIVVTFERFFSFILSATTATHMIICVLMSSEYRENAVSLVRSGYVRQIIPCIAFPVVTLFLILKIRKANIQRQKLESSSETKKSKNTSKLVLCLTLPFFIAELPLGIVFWMSQSDIFVVEERYYFILEAFEKCFSFILSATTATHMIICVFMSSQYRESLISVIQCGFVSPANARQKEANRVIRDAFHQLQMVLPWKNNDGVPTRRMILWRAIEHIRRLNSMLGK